MCVKSLQSLGSQAITVWNLSSIGERERESEICIFSVCVSKFVWMYFFVCVCVSVCISQWHLCLCNLWFPALGYKLHFNIKGCYNTSVLKTDSFFAKSSNPHPPSPHLFLPSLVQNFAKLLAKGKENERRGKKWWKHKSNEACNWWICILAAS